MLATNFKKIVLNTIKIYRICGADVPYGLTYFCFEDFQTRSDITKKPKTLEAIYFSDILPTLMFHKRNVTSHHV